VRVATTIDNSSGNIWGGGGAAGTSCDSTNTYCVNGQAGTTGPSGVGGSNGYNSYVAYAAGRGGAYAQPGTAGPSGGGAGGAAGYAVRKNGFSVVFSSGNTATRVAGLVN
jgi:hypothetical protein